MIRIAQRFALLVLLAASAANAQKTLKPGQGAAVTGKYRNLFVEAGYSAKDVQQKIKTAYEQLFHGDTATQSVVFQAGKNDNGPLAYLMDINNNDARSEGMSYGMMIAVQMNRKDDFDALWNWSKTYMYRDEEGHPTRGFFSWSMNADGTIRDETPAPDGEEYWVTALYMADKRWGSGKGIYNYKAEADKLLTTMLHHEVVTGRTKRGPYTSGNMFDPDQKMVRFVPGHPRHTFTDPSYHLPAFYELWAKWGPEADRAFWAECAKVSRDFFQKATHPTTGLAPDYANFDGTPYSMGPNRGGPGNFRADAWRTAMNWSVDWAWWAKDPREQVLSDRIQAFFRSKGLATYGSQYALDGTELRGSHSTGLTATNAVASLAATGPQSVDFVKALWEVPVPSGRGRYYDGMLYMMAMLHLGGEFRAWGMK